MTPRGFHRMSSPSASARAALAILLAAGAPAHAQKVSYPATRMASQVDTYFGVRVSDPYRWLEDDKSPETAAWVGAQNGVTFDYLAKIPYRDALKARLSGLENYERFGAPTRNGRHYIFTRNTGLQNQSVVYIQDGLDGSPEVLIDPNTFSADGTTKLLQYKLSKDGRYVAYSVSQGGSDWMEFHVMELASRNVLPDVVKWGKSSNIAWQGNGFYYSRYDEPGSTSAMTSKNEGHTVWFHTIGTPQDRDTLVFEDKANPQRLHHVFTTADERFATLSVQDRGKGKKGNALFFRDGNGPWKPLQPDIGDDLFQVIDHIDGRFVLSTNRKAPNGRVVAIDPDRPEESQWKVLIPERADPLRYATSAGGRLIGIYMKDVTTRAYVHGADGTIQNEIILPGLGTAVGFTGGEDDTSLFYTFETFNVPPSVYRYDLVTRKSTLFRAPKIPGFRPADYVTEQVFYHSKDGTRVPMFLTYRKGMRRDGANPTLMYGYGGFGSSIVPAFSSLRIALLEQGVIYASANIRGGAEYGEKWHEAGMKERKQNVFDDFIAAAEYLVAKRYTSPGKLAIHGVSNGGLLVGAVANQRPDLFKVVLQQAGVMDLLRFHKFTVGWNWTSDYGSPEGSPGEFRTLFAYSPIHNIKPGTAYPATLITTADHDDRVVPAHSFKYAATLQAAQAGDNPVLIRIDTQSGHTASSTTKAIEQSADLYAFLFHNLKVAPTFLP